MSITEIGESDRFLYYNGSGETTTFDLSLHIRLRKDLNRTVLKESAQKAVKSFPEFAYRPVVKDNTIWREENLNEVPLLSADRRYRYGTEDTAGYAFCIRCDENNVIISCAHGMTDYYGLTAFTHTIFYHYATGIGIEAEPDEKTRICAKPAYSMDETERLNPYVRFGSAETIPVWKYQHEPPLEAKEECYPFDADYARTYLIACPVADFLRLTKETEVSAAALMAVIAGRAMGDAYGTDKSVVEMLPVNMRPFYHTGTMVNFSDGIFLRYEPGLRSRTLDYQTIAIRGRMELQLQRENFDGLLYEKAKMAEEFAGSKKPIADMIRELNAPAAADGESIMTCALTYVGKHDFPPEYNSLIRHVAPRMYGKGLGIMVYSYGDTLYFCFIQQFDADVIAQAVKKELEAIGLDSTLTDTGYYCGNLLLIEDPKRRQSASD